MRWSLVAAAVLVAVLTGGCFNGLNGVLGGGNGPKDFVSSGTYRKWIVEVEAVQGMSPPAGVLDFVKGRLDSVVSKPDGIEFRIDAPQAAHGGTWSDHDIENFDQATRDASTSGSTVTLHLLFLDGKYSQGNVLGVTYGNSAHTSSGPIAIFSQSIRDACTNTPLCLDATPGWKAVLVHEFGHAIGLVNNGIPMVQAHEASTCNGNPDKGHSTNQNSVMFCSVEQAGLFSFFQTPPNDYDAADRADLCQAGGKC